MVKIKKVIVSLLVAASALFGSSKYAGEFINYSVDARSLALGNLTLNSFNGAEAVYWNASNLAFSNSDAVTLTHSERFEGMVQQEFAAYKTEYEGFNLGIGLIRIGVDDIPLTKLDDENGQISGTNRPYIYDNASDNEIALLVSYGRKYTDNLSYGVTAKMLGKFMEVESAYGIGFDLSGTYKYTDNISVAAKIADITTSALFWSTGENEFISPSLYLQGEYSGYYDYYKTAYKVMGGFKMRSEGYEENAFLAFSIFDLSPSVAAELLFHDTAFLRFGIENEEWAAGTGLKLYGAYLDYTFKPDHTDLGDTHKITLSYGW